MKMDIDCNNRKNKQGHYLSGDKNTISDGYVKWSIWCPVCGCKTMQVVRPGKVQCINCG